MCFSVIVLEALFTHITHTSSSGLRSRITSMASYSSEQQTPVARSPLEDPACLRLVHDFLGTGHYSFIAPVSKLWKQSYEATPSLSTTGFDITCNKISLPCDSKTTFYSSIFTSTSRVHLTNALKTSSKLNVWRLAKLLLANLQS